MSEPLETIEKKNSICLETIDRIGASGVPIITALNKIDRLEKKETDQKLEKLKEKIKNPIPISALRRINLAILKETMLRKFEDYVQLSFSVPLTNKTMTFISSVHNEANVKKVKYTSDSVQVTFESDPSVAERVRKQVGELGGQFETETQNQ